MIVLDFAGLCLKAELFDCDIARRLEEMLPCDISLTNWGNEVYGSIGEDLGEENSVPEIPAGGIAYTNQGNYLCIFFGQQPAWPVEYIGQIQGDAWRKLLDADLRSVVVKIEE